MLQNIQALRALAAYLVVVVHLEELWLHRSGTHLFAFGYAGVDLFFVISGFIMVYTSGAKHTTPGSFAFNRILRVVPLYWLITFVVFFMAFVAPMEAGATRADPMELLKSLLFFPYLKSNGLIKPVVFLGWTLNYEMFFYLLFTLGLFAKNRAVGLAAMVTCIGALAVGGMILQPTGTIGKFYTNSILVEFALGIVIGTFYTEITTARHLYRYSIAAILVAVVLIVLKGFYWNEAPRLLAYGIPSAFIVAGVVNLEARGIILRNSTVQFLGNASYSIYLTHFFATKSFQKLGAILHAESVATFVALALATFLMVTLLGVLTHVHVERRLTRWVKAIFGQKREVRDTKTDLPPAQKSTI